MKTPKTQQSGQITFHKRSIVSYPMGKNAKKIPAFAYNPQKKALSKRDIHRLNVKQRKGI